MHRRSFLASLGTGTLASTAGCLDRIESLGGPPTARKPEEVLGVAHLDGRYHFTDEPFLVEGAKTIAELGTKVLRIWLDLPGVFYSHNDDLDDVYDSLVEVVNESSYRRVFEMDFSTYLLTATANHRWPRSYYTDGVSGREANQEEQRFEALTRHLMATYDGTGKTFVLQDSESDYRSVPDGDASHELDEETIHGLTRWYEARQTGVEAGREAVDSDVTVLHAAELSVVLDAKRGDAARVVNRVLPNVDLDLVGYSAYEVGGQITGSSWLPGQNDREEWDEAERIITETLDYIADQHSPTGAAESVLAAGQSPVYIGEFGAPLQEMGPERAMRAIRTQLEQFLSWGARWTIFWQVYGNERVTEDDVVTDGTVTSRDELRGFYLVRPDGSRAPTWDYFQSVLDRETVGPAE